MLGTKMEAAALLLTPPTPEGRDPPSLGPKTQPQNLKAFEVVQGQTTTWRKTRRNLFDTHTDPVVKELGIA